ncbi:MAG: histidine kinase [Pseudomonadota bacterium]
MPDDAPPSLPRADRRLWLAYAGACLLAWLLHILSGLDAQRGNWQLWQAAYQATWSTWPPMLLGLGLHPWARALLRRRPPLATAALHVLGALAFGALWQALEFFTAAALFGAAHAKAVLQQALVAREIAGVLVYAAVVTAFTAVLQAQRARAAAVAAAQAEAGMARAELAAISGRLNPHFLFNTLNLMIALTRKDPRAAEDALMRFSGMLRYVLSAKRDATERVPLEDEMRFVRDYLALEAQRLGTRLQVDWQVDEATLADPVPPLTLQPLVENAVAHGVAPRVQGGRVQICSQRIGGEELHLSVADDGAGCEPAQLQRPPMPGRTGGVGLAALRRRFALDYEGRARLKITTSPGAGFRVDLWIPLT